MDYIKILSITSLLLRIKGIFKELNQKSFIYYIIDRHKKVKH